jgi:hypothetical protein
MLFLVKFLDRRIETEILELSQILPKLGPDEIILNPEEYEYFSKHSSFASVVDNKVVYTFTPINSTPVYIRRRVLEYPPITDQLEALWRLANDPQDPKGLEMKAKINNIRTNAPKDMVEPE